MLIDHAGWSLLVLVSPILLALAAKSYFLDLWYVGYRVRGVLVLADVL